MVITLVLAIILILGTSPLFEIPMNSIIKVSSQNLNPNGGTCVILISWYGCPFGAADSWSIYLALSSFGKLNFTYGHSDPLDAYPNTPALIFTGFSPNSSIEFKFVYLYNEFLNSTANGTKVSNYVTYGLNKIKEEFPWTYSIIKEYVTEKWASGGFFQPAAYLGNPPHIPTTILITGKQGTYILIGYIYNPSVISGLSPQFVMSHINSIPQIERGSKTIEALLS
nr:DUF929 domain-containing protein [Candidatus Acidianus copahuensis]